MFDIALKVFLFFSPIIFLPYINPVFNGHIAKIQWFHFGYFSSSSNLFQLQFFQFGTIFLFLISLFEKQKRHFNDKNLGALFCFFVFSVLIHPKTIDGFHNIFLGFLLYYLVVCYTKNVYSVLKVVVIVAFINTAFAVLQKFGIHLFYKETVEIIGLMSYKSQLGIYQAMAVPICYMINPLLAAVPFIGLILSKSITSLVAGMAGVLFLFRHNILKSKSMPVLMCIISIAVGLFLYGFQRFSLRLNVWSETFGMILDHLFVGHGINTFEYIIRKGEHIRILYEDPYSIILQVIYFLGIFSVIPLFLFIKDKLFFKKRNFLLESVAASCVTLIVSGSVYSFMNYARIGGTAIVLFGLLTILKKRGRE